MSSCINFFPLHLFASIINDISYFYACLLWCDRTNGPLNPLWDRWFEGPQESQGCRCWILWYWWLSSGFIALIVDCWLLAESSSYRVQHFLAMLWHMFDRVLRCVESNSYMATFLNFQIYNEILHCAIHDEFLWEIQMYGTIYSNGNEYWAQFDSTQWHFLKIFQNHQYPKNEPSFLCPLIHFLFNLVLCQKLAGQSTLGHHRDLHQ